MATSAVPKSVYTAAITRQLSTLPSIRHRAGDESFEEGEVVAGRCVLEQLEIGVTPGPGNTLVAEE